MIDLLLHTLSALDCGPLEAREDLERPALETPDCEICSEPTAECICCARCLELGEVCDDCTDDRPRDGETNDEFFSRIYGIPSQGEI